MGDNDEVKASGKSMSYILTPAAYQKIVLHAAKYAWADIYGFVLGTVKDGKVKLADVVPLFHTTVFGPMLEVSTMLVKEYCKSEQTPKGCEIVGFYSATARNNYAGTPALVKRIASTIQGDCSAACLLLVDNQALEDESKTPFKLFTGETWRPCTSLEVEEDKKTAKELTELLRNKKQDSVVDIEAWLADTSLDWRNPTLLSA